MALITSRRTQYSAEPPRANNVVAILILIVALAIGALITAAAGNPVPIIVFAVVGVVLMQAPRVAQQWERAVVLRLGKYVGLRGPGLFWIMPFVDTVSSWIDQRTITTSFAAEQTLTSDTVPVNDGRRGTAATATDESRRNQVVGAAMPKWVAERLPLAERRSVRPAPGGVHIGSAYEK